MLTRYPKHRQVYIAMDTSAWVTRHEQPKGVKDEVKAGLIQAKGPKAGLKGQLYVQL